MKTEFSHDGLMISAQDLSAISPQKEDHDRMFHHDGSSSISMVGGSSSSQRGYYVWDKDEQAWYALFHNADKLDGKESGAFLHRDGSLPMEGELDVGHYGLTNADSISSGVGSLLLNSNNAVFKASSGGASVQLKDNNGLLLVDAQEGGDVDVSNGSLYEQGSRVATRSWTNANADVANADYADEADTLDGEHASSFLHVSGDQMEGVLDLGGFDLNDSGAVKYDAISGNFVQSALGGPASSLTSYPLPAGDLAEDYTVTSRFPLPASDLAEDYVLTSRLPLPASDLAEDYAVTSRFPIPNSDIANSTVTVNAGNQLTGGGSVGLGGSITVDVDENNLDADTIDGAHKSDLDSQYVDAGGDWMSGKLTVSSSDGPVEIGGDLNGSIELGDSTSSEDKPFIDFNFGVGSQQDYNARIQNNGDEKLSINSPNSPTFNVKNGVIQESGNRVATRAWTNANADVPNANYADSAGDSDTLDGEHASAFADAGHLHDGRYILEGGDTMSGVLTLSDGSTAASRSWVNANADVPNADYADSAGDSNTLDGLDSSQFLRSDTPDTLNATLSVSGETEVQFGDSNYHVRYDTTRDTLILGSAENGEVMEMDSSGNLRIEGSLTEGATIST